MPRHALILDQETRWSSTHAMLETFCCKKAIILAYIEFKKFGIEILESNRKSWVGNFANRCGITRNLCWCREFLWKREFVHLCGNGKCKVYHDHFGRDWLQRSGWTTGGASAEHKSTFENISIPSKKASCGLQPCWIQDWKWDFFTKRSWSSRVIAGPAGCSSANRNN